MWLKVYSIRPKKIYGHKASPHASFLCTGAPASV